MEQNNLLPIFSSPNQLTENNQSTNSAEPKNNQPVDDSTEDNDSSVSETKKRKNKKKPPKPKKTQPKKVYTGSAPEYGVLVVDDEPLWLNIYERNLFNHIDPKKYKFKFYRALNGIKGVQVLAEFYSTIKIIILDLRMPKKGGLDFLKIIYDLLGFDELGIFVITAYATENEMQEVLLRGVKGFIDKSQLEFDRLSELMVEFIELEKREKAKDQGFFIESRLNGQERYIYLRWKLSDGQWLTQYLGKAGDLNNLTIPNIITPLHQVEGLLPTDRRTRLARSVEHELESETNSDKADSESQE